jgi:polyisoprenoid-binding protein YceI
VGVLGLLYSTGGAEPSQSAAEAAPTLSLDQATPTPSLLNQIATDVRTADDAVVTEIAAVNARLDALSTEVSGLQGAAVAATQNATEVVTEEAAATAETAATDEATAEAAASDGDELPERALFRIDPEQSEARFKIDETLTGNRITVVGVTDDIAGDVIVNYQDPAASQLGEIAINARTLRTDNDFRNQAIRGRILETNDYEFIRFQPTAIRSLAGDVSVGDTVEFEVDGDLTVRDTTNPVTFTVSLTADAVDQISGLAVTEIMYADYGITINAPPTVADIGDVVTLEFDFVATRVEDEG